MGFDIGINGAFSLNTIALQSKVIEYCKEGNCKPYVFNSLEKYKFIIWKPKCNEYVNHKRKCHGVCLPGVSYYD